MSAIVGGLLGIVSLLLAVFTLLEKYEAWREKSKKKDDSNE